MYITSDIFVICFPDLLHGGDESTETRARQGHLPGKVAGRPHQHQAQVLAGNQVLVGGWRRRKMTLCSNMFKLR